MKKALIFLLTGTLVVSACTSLATPKITITFSADEKCTMEGPTTIPADKIIPVDIIGNIEGGGDIAVVILHLDSGKTIKDLQEWHAWNPPSWSTMGAVYKYPSDGNTYSFDLSAANGPVYFACLYEFAEGQIGALGPIEVKK